MGDPAPAPHRALQVEADQQPRAVAASYNQGVQAEAHQAPHRALQAEVARPPAAQAEAARLLLRVEVGVPQAAQVEVQMAPVLARVGLLRRGIAQPPTSRAWPARWSQTWNSLAKPSGTRPQTMSRAAATSATRITTASTGRIALRQRLTS